MTVNRRGFIGLGAAGIGAAGIAGAAMGAEQAAATARSEASQAILGDVVSPWGHHQAGIEMHQQAHANLLGFDFHGESDSFAVQRWLRLITQDIERLAQGQPVLADPQPELALGAASLTVTVGLSRKAFTKLGLKALLPSGFIDLPAFEIDRLEKRWGQTDILFQVSADDPMVQAHAVRSLIRDTSPFATIRWNQTGFANAKTGASKPMPVRNLMGHIDGTDNPKFGSSRFEELVWMPKSAGAFAGGTQLALRRIDMNLSTWDSIGTRNKDLAIGRRVDTGAPLTGTLESDIPDLNQTNEFGLPVIPMHAHIRRAAGQKFNQQFFRRPFNYQDAQSDGSVTSGLLFLAYAANLEEQFLPVQQQLADFDLLNLWTTPVGSATYLMLPGFKPGEQLGQTLFG